MNKYLVKENTGVAEANICNIEEVYIKPLATLANAINGLGLEVNKENLYDAIANNGDGLMQLFNDARNNYGEMDARLAGVAEEVDNKKIQAFTNALLPFKGVTTIYNDMSISNPDLLCCVGINENGNVYLLDSTKEEIIENAKEYCNTKSGKDLFDLHQKIAKELQILYDGMNEIRNTPNHHLSHDARFAMMHYPAGLFEIINIGDKFEISPRNINFDAIVEVDDDFDFDDDSDDE